MTTVGFFPESSLLQVAAPTSVIPKCGACGLFKTCQSPKMPHSGKGERRVLIIAEAPGRDEDRKGTQLIGQAGSLLSDVLKSIGVNMRRDCVLTNSLICRPPNNAAPTNNQLAYCLPNTLNTIRVVKPHVIIPLGAAAVKQVVGHYWRDKPGAITRWVGWNIPCQSSNAWICPTFHPSYLLRQQNNVALHRAFKQHLRAAFAHDGRPWKKLPDYESQVELVVDVDIAADMILEFCKSSVPVAFDYECNMVKPEPHNAAVISASLSDGERTIAFPWRGPVVRAFKKFLRSRVPKIAHNMKFEDRWSWKLYHKRVRNWAWDTMHGAHLIDNRRGIVGLKFQSYVILGKPRYDTHIEKFLKAKEGKTVNQITSHIGLDDLLLYNGLDSLLEVLVAVRQMDILKYRI